MSGGFLAYGSEYSHTLSKALGLNPTCVQHTHDHASASCGDGSDSDNYDDFTTHDDCGVQANPGLLTSRPGCCGDGSNSDKYDDFTTRLRCAGKSTAINLMTGLLEASSGTAMIEGRKLGEDMQDIYKMMGVCPQVRASRRLLRPLWFLTVGTYAAHVGLECCDQHVCNACWVGVSG